MRYAPTYNAPGFKCYQENNQDTKLTIIDLILLNEINEMSRTWENINTKVFEDKQFFNISYSKLIEQLPGINISTSDGMAKRLKKGLIKEGLIETFIDRSDNSKVYFTLTELGNKINSYQVHERNHTDKQPSTSRTNDRQPHGRTTVNPTDERPTNKNINNKSINNKRENTLAIQFLNENDPQRFEVFKNQYQSKIDNWLKFTKDFNNKVIIERLNFDSNILYARLETYAGNWIQNKSKNGESVPSVKDIKFN